MLCFNVGHRDRRYHGQGIAKAMIEYLEQWSRDRGWRRIEAHSCPDITRTTDIGDWMFRRGPLERRGFHVVEEMHLPPDEASERLKQIKAHLAGRNGLQKGADWYADNVHRLTADPTWQSE
jgi:hypothetical protein